MSTPNVGLTQLSELEASHLQPTFSCHFTAILPYDIEALFFGMLLHLIDPHACLIMIYLLTLSPSQNIQLRVTECLLNNEVEGNGLPLIGATIAGFA
jgi:hypothetical protein